MPVELPPTHLFYHPILRYLVSQNGAARRQVIFDKVADLLALDDEQRSRLANDRTPSHAYRSGWSLSVLKKAGLLSNPSTGLWSLNEKGRELLKRFPRELDGDAIARINAVWWTKKEEEELNRVAGTGQGVGLTSAGRRAVELYAMQRAKEYLTDQGWSWKDTSANNPFDYLAKRKGKAIVVEVKGTTGKGHSILLTANEVELQKRKYPDNALIVVHSIALNRKAKRPIASRGQVLVIMSWQVVSDRLLPRMYQYDLGDGSER